MCGRGVSPLSPQPERKGPTLPTKRSGHTATLIGSELFIFGGGDGNALVNDLFVFDMLSESWSQPAVTGAVPSPRSRHTAAATAK